MDNIPARPVATGPTPIKVTSCGSTRWPEEFTAAIREETLSGKIVISVGLYGHKECMDMDGSVKLDLDNLHLHKIAISDEILVLNPEVAECLDCGLIDRPPTIIECAACGSTRLLRHNRIGYSTAREIAFARSQGKRVRYRY